MASLYYIRIYKQYTYVSIRIHGEIKFQKFNITVNSCHITQPTPLYKDIRIG